MALFRVVYHSRRCPDPSARPLEEIVDDILAVSVANNCNVGVTGGLLYDHEWFAQVLEGERDAVIRRLERISEDKRHTEIAVLDASNADTRRFSQWWMASAGWQKTDAGLFLPEVSTRDIDPRELGARALIDLVEAVMHYQARKQGRLPWTTRSVTNAA